MICFDCARRTMRRERIPTCDACATLDVDPMLVAREQLAMTLKRDRAREEAESEKILRADRKYMEMALKYGTSTSHGAWAKTFGYGNKRGK